MWMFWGNPQVFGLMPMGSGRVLELGIDVARGQQAEVANLYELVG
jgi:glycosyltransferase A (GT-A) superfamily protein (DUF2064 family)